MTGLIEILLILPGLMGGPSYIAELNLLEHFLCIYCGRKIRFQNPVVLLPVNLRVKVNPGAVRPETDSLFCGKICLPPLHHCRHAAVRMLLQPKRTAARQFFRRLLIHPTQLPGVIVYIHIPVKLPLVQGPVRVLIPALPGYQADNLPPGVQTDTIKSILKGDCVFVFLFY